MKQLVRIDCNEYILYRELEYFEKWFIKDNRELSGDQKNLLYLIDVDQLIPERNKNELLYLWFILSNPKFHVHQIGKIGVFLMKKCNMASELILIILKRDSPTSFGEENNRLAIVEKALDNPNLWSTDQCLNLMYRGRLYYTVPKEAILINVIEILLFTEEDDLVIKFAKKYLKDRLLIDRDWVAARLLELCPDLDYF